MVDILGQYDGRPETPNVPQWSGPAQEGFLLRLLTKLSGGKIRDERQANYLLVGLAVIVILISSWVFFRQARPSGSGGDVLSNTPMQGVRPGGTE